MKIPSRNILLFNAAAGILVLAAIGTTVRSVLFTEETPSCSDRYQNGVVFGVTSGGQPLAGVDLQSRAGVEEWGLVENVAVVAVKDAPVPHSHAMRYRFAAAKMRGEADTKARHGAGFHWSPQTYQKRGAACLSYSVMLPAGFDAGRGVALPGLAGTTGDKLADERGVATRLNITSNGIEAIARLDADKERSHQILIRSPSRIPAGQWVTIDQEVVLNTPGAKNGIMRVWVAGKLLHESTNLVLRETAEQVITGVAADVVHTGIKTDGELLLTPFELRWP